MKTTMHFNTLALLLLMTGLPLAQAYAQPAAGDSEMPKNIIKTNPLAVIWGPIPFTGEYRVAYERVITAKQSAQLTLSYLGPSPILNLENLTVQDTVTGQHQSIGISGYRVQLTYKFFLTKDREAPKGFYVAPHVSYATAKAVSTTNAGDYLKASYLNAVCMLGYQIVAGRAFAFDMFTGLGYKDNVWTASSVTNSSFKQQPTSNNTKVYFGFNLGYAF